MKSKEFLDNIIALMGAMYAVHWYLEIVDNFEPYKLFAIPLVGLGIFVCWAYSGGGTQ